MSTPPPPTLEYAPPTDGRRMSRLAQAAPLLPLVTCSCCLASAFVPRSLTELLSPGSDVAQRMIRTVPIPLAAVGVSLVALLRIARRPHELKGLPDALLGLALNVGVLLVAAYFAWVGDIS
jgi:hypothetical protein